MNFKWIISCFMIICLTLLSGCWSSKELTDLGIISAYALDKNEDGEYVGTFQIINPMNVPGSLQGGASGQRPAVTTFTETGVNPTELSNRASRKISRDLYYSHTSLLVISEELARDEGLSAILDSMERALEFRATAKVVITRGIKAGDFIKVLTGIDQIPAENVLKTLDSTEKLYGENINTNLQEFIQSLTSTGKEPLVSGFSLLGDMEKGKTMEQLHSTDFDAILEANGLAVFKEGKLVNWLDGEKARGTMWGLNRIHETPVSIDWENHKKAIAYRVIRQKTDVSAQMKDGKPAISITIRAEGDLRTVAVPVDVTDPHVLLAIEKALGQEIKKEVEAAVQEAKENKTDVFGFGEKLHQSEPDVWKKLEQEWQDVSFPELDVDITVEAFIRRTGVRNNPYLFDLEKKSD
ncbi:Ger(x)C family spore germination protein [Oceanobacillus sp. CFH 90083]|uniref:Ger(x)C family spore germination protein n=1 Tax=Oceanobacillus sp. CFH 90083 TaxID=2592336 RepID=UPI00128DFEA4|nr:Ger(x)C family spore germination protein [Oceanobacillus sp. CFH 90083]